MLTGKDYLKEHIEETNIPEEHWENEIGEMMDAYADYYHKAELKLLNLHLVDSRRELLNDFFTKVLNCEREYNDKIEPENVVDLYLKGIL